MNRIDRLTAILVQLQSKKVVTAQEVADRFEISLRTVYRDIRALEEAGIPIGAEAGKGYFILDGYHLPPVMFTQDEANALVLGSKLIGGQTDESVKKNFGEAMYKIKSVLKVTEKEELERLESQIQVTSIPTPESDDFPNNFLANIQTALVSSNVLRFKYFSNYTGDFNIRDVEPIGLVFYGNHWHLLAYCRMRKAPRDFRVDRLVKLEVLEEKFDPSVRPAFQDFILDIMRGTELEEVGLKVRKDIARLLGEMKYQQGFVSQTEEGEYLIMKFLTPTLEYFSRWLMSLGDAATVIYPETLNDLMRRNVQELNDHYSK